MNRRGLVAGLGALFVAAPAIVRVSSLMAMPRRPLLRTPTGFLSAEDVKRVLTDEYRRLAELRLVENPDLFASSIIVEQNEFEPNRVDIVFQPVPLKPLAQVARTLAQAFENVLRKNLDVIRYATP